MSIEKMQLVNIAGLVKGASNGEGLGNKFLSHIREVHAIDEVVKSGGTKYSVCPVFKPLGDLKEEQVQNIDEGVN